MGLVRVGKMRGKSEHEMLTLIRCRRATMYDVARLDRYFDQRLGRSTYFDLRLLRRAGESHRREIVVILIERQTDAERGWIPQTGERADRRPRLVALAAIVRRRVAAEALLRAEIVVAESGSRDRP